jgi:hypothetical protein
MASECQSLGRFSQICLLEVLVPVELFLQRCCWGTPEGAFEWLYGSGLVARVPGYRPRGPGFDSWRYYIIWEAVRL